MAGSRTRSAEVTEGGFTLVEVLAASFVAIILFVVFSTTLVQAFVGSRDTRFRQEATSIANDYVEIARTLEWPELAMTEIDTSAPWLNPSGTHLLASESNLDTDEPLLVLTGGMVSPLVTETVQDVTFEVWSYVTRTAAANRRYVVVVTWDLEDSPRSLHMSTVISEVAT